LEAGLTTEKLIYVGRAAGWLVTDALEPGCDSGRAVFGAIDRGG
jgi:hypothetical protein